MSRSHTVAVVIVSLLVGAAGGYLLGRHRAPRADAEHEHEASTSGESEASADEEQVATVRVAPVRRGTIPRTIIAYGPVVARAGESRAVSVAYEARVQKVFVVAGQRVDAGTPLLRVEPSPESRLALAEARRAQAAAEADLKRVQSNFDAKLATNAERATVEQAADAARLKLESLTQRGGGGEDAAQEFKADVAGIVSVVAAQTGQIVAPGATLVEVVPADRIEVRLGVPPADIRAVTPGLAVKLMPVGANDTEPVAGKVRIVAQKVSPDTRFVDVFASPAADNHLVLDEYTRGELSLPGREGLVVPRSALLPTEEGQVLFTVVGGKAVRHIVTLIAEDRQNAEVESADVHDGDEAVVLGNFELEDGMAVAAQPAAAEAEHAEPSTREAATTPAATTRSAPGEPPR
jgi:RND family efflux transporter MFP subunit